MSDFFCGAILSAIFFVPATVLTLESLSKKSDERLLAEYTKNPRKVINEFTRYLLIRRIEEASKRRPKLKPWRVWPMED